MKAQMYKGIWHTKEDWDENGRSKIFPTAPKPFGVKTEAKETKKVELVVRNKKGYNRYKKNPKPKIEIVKEQKVTKDEVVAAYKELWLAKRVVLSKAQKYARLNNLFMGYDKINKELSLQYDKDDD